MRRCVDAGPRTMNKPTKEPPKRSLLVGAELASLSPFVLAQPSLLVETLEIFEKASFYFLKRKA